MSIFLENILSFKLFFKSDNVNSEQELFGIQRITFEKKISETFASIKIENRLHEILKILFTRKIKFQKI